MGAGQVALAQTPGRGGFQAEKEWASYKTMLVKGGKKEGRHCTKTSRGEVSRAQGRVIFVGIGG